MASITPNQMKSEIEEHTKGTKTYEDMLDKFVNYIIFNYTLKKNRKPISTEEIKIIPKTFTANTDISEELTEAIILEEKGRQGESENAIKESLDNFENMDIDDDFDDDFTFQNHGSNNV